MIYDLEILNGDLELKFNEYTYFYTVKVKKDISQLEFSYKLQDNVKVEILNNELLDAEEEVTLKVSNEEQEVIYTFQVSKEKEEEVSLIDLYKENLNVNVPEYNFQAVLFLIIAIFFSIVLLFSFIFKRKR